MEPFECSYCGWIGHFADVKKDLDLYCMVCGSFLYTFDEAVAFQAKGEQDEKRRHEKRGHNPHNQDRPV